jgi:uncharacterized membrane protein YqaE (UPF0057 family)
VGAAARGQGLVAVESSAPGLPVGGGRKDAGMKKVLLIILCFFLPFLAVLIHEGLTRRVLWAIVFQLLGHIPGIVYGIYVVTSEPRADR